jgi:Ca-activated chloride channel family protein
MNLTLRSIYPTLIPLAQHLAQRLPGPAVALFLARLLIPLAILLGFILPQILPAAPATDAAANSDRTLSPYFQVQSLDAPGDALPLKATHIAVTIAGVIADVTVTQTYANTGTVPLEALYVFPGSTRAAVHGLTMTVGDRRTRAQIQRREEARATYEAAKTAGKTATLLEQQRPNVFQMAVANILPGDVVEVELRYTELLTPVDGVYEFVYPGVVGPRYSNRPAAGATTENRWVANPYLPEDEPDPVLYDIAVRLAAGLPIREVACRTHSTQISYASPADARITLAPSEGSAGDRDFILRYQLVGEAVQAGLLVGEGPDDAEKFFLAMVQPPASPKPAAMPPRDYVFIVDVSGSMHGFPIDTAKHLLRQMLPTLRPKDTFNVLLFAGDSQVLSATPLPATSANLSAALSLLDQQRGGGGTELLPALRRALALPRPAENMSRTVAVVTDGYVDIETEAYALVRQSLGQGNVFAFGIGTSVNRHLIESLARAGQGEPFIVTDVGAAETEAARFAAMIGAPVLTAVAASFDGVKASEIEPASLPDVFAQRPVVLFGQWSGEADGSVRIDGRTGAKPFVATMDFAKATRVPVETLARLWARTRIAQLSDDLAVRQDPERVSAITTLGLKYELLTAYTSFIAVDEVVRRKTPELEKVTQPLPLPSGVSNHAVGGGSHTPVVPEPATTGLLITGGVLGFAMLRRRRRKGRSEQA